MDGYSGPVPLRLWRAADVLPTYGCIPDPDDLSGKERICVDLEIPELRVVHAAACAGLTCPVCDV